MKKLLDITTGWIAIITVLVPLACQAAAPIPLVNHSDTWRYLKGTTEPQTDWKTATDSVLDASWLSGFIAWLDGVYLTSANSPGAPAQPSHIALATGDHESSRGNNSPSEAVLYDLTP